MFSEDNMLRYGFYLIKEHYEIIIVKVIKYM